MDIILYHCPTTCSHVAMNALEAIGVDFEDRLVHLATGQHRSAAYLAVNPRGKVPALSVDGRIITENAAILVFLNEIFPSAGILPFTVNSIEAHQNLADLIWCSSVLHPIVRQIRMPRNWTTGEIEEVRNDGMEKFAAECAVFSNRLEAQEWWYGDQWSIIDSYIYWAYCGAKIGGFRLERYPALMEHASRVKARDSFKRARDRELSAARCVDMPIVDSFMLSDA